MDSKEMSVNVPSTDEVFEHFGITATECGEISIFSSEKVERIGTVIKFDLSKGKGRAVIDYDPAYPFAVLKTITNFPNIPETYKVGLDGERFVLEPVMPMDSKDQCR